MSVSPGGVLQLQYKVTGSWFICVLFRLPKEKERGSKGRAIYRAVGGQVIYATHTAPTAYALRHPSNAIFITSTRTDTIFNRH